MGVLAAAGVLAAVPALAGADSPRDRATGGGQAFLGSTDGTGAGAGDTVAFTAQRLRGATGTSTAATGQIQVNRRTTNAVKFHGTITCLVVTGGKSKGAAFMSGTSRATKTAPAQPFELYVTDGGSGPTERDDSIALAVGNDDTNGPGDAGPCGLEEDVEGIALARGNVQTHNASTAEDPATSSQPAGGRLGLLPLS